MHVLLAAHPADDAPPHAVVVATHDDGPQGSQSMPCFAVSCGCKDWFPLRPADPQEAMRALVAVVSHGQEADSDGLSAFLPAEQPGIVDRAANPGDGESEASPPDLLDALQRSVNDARARSAATNERLGIQGAAGPITDAAPVAEPRRTPSDPGVFELHASGQAFSWRLRDEHGDEVAIGKLYDGRDEARAAIDTAVAAAGGDPAAVWVVDHTVVGQ